MSKTIITSSELNELKTEIYGNAVLHGFHDENHTVDHFLGLVLSEIGEAINADRNPDAPTVMEATLDQAKLLADQSIGGAAFVEFFKSNIKGSVIEELADVAIRILDLAGDLCITFEDNLEIRDSAGIDTLPGSLFGLWKELAQMCACAAGSFFCLGAYIFLFESIKRQDKYQSQQGATFDNAHQQAIQVLDGVSLAADRLTVSSDTKIEIPLKNGTVCIDRVEGLENEQLMITSNSSKMFRCMWIYPLTSDAIVVEIK